MRALALAPDNPMIRALMSVLVCEVIAFALAIPGMVFVEHMPTSTAVPVGLVPVVLAAVASVRLRYVSGFVVAWLAQVSAVAVGFWTPWMFLVGGIFLLTWAVSFALGRKLEKDGPSAQNRTR